MNVHAVPPLLKKLASGLVWEGDAAENAIYLTFDDGPVPGPTEFVLDVLAAYQAKATFFAVGENVKRHEAIAQRVVEEGHVLANHTQRHLKGWQHTTQAYLQSVDVCQQTIVKATGSAPMLFRPPYGRISPKQSAALKKQGYSIVMWTVLSADYDSTLTPGNCLVNTYKLCRPGAIVVFHDSPKAAPRMEKVLPALLEALSKEDYQFKALGG